MPESTPPSRPTPDESGPGSRSPDHAAMLGLGLVPPGSGGAREWQPPEIDWLNAHLCGYEIHHLLGRGGMGAVYLARQTTLDRKVAIKIIPPALAGDVIHRERFHREARLLAQLRHPGIVSIYDFGSVDEQIVYLVMEYIEGGTLDELIRSGPIPLDRAVRLMSALGQAVRAAHEAGLVHRDIKPGNILLTHDDHVKLADFGLAVAHTDRAAALRLTTTGTTVGTLAYLAPELFEGVGADDPSRDIYSLGVVFYQMLTGRLPHGAYTPISTLIGTPRAIDTIVQKAMAADPAHRYRSVDDFLTDLTRCQLGRSLLIRPIGLSVATLALVILLLLGLLIWRGMDDSTQLPSESPRATEPIITEASPAPLADESLPSVTSGSTDHSPDASVPTRSGAPADESWISLLDELDPAAATMRGGWTMTEAGLISDEQQCVIEVSANLPASYDLRMRFIRRSGVHSVVLFFPFAGRVGAAELDAWDQQLGGVQDIDGQDMRGHGESFPFQIVNGRAYDMLIEVRPTRINFYVDGQLMRRYDMRGRTLTLQPIWELPRPPRLGLGSWESSTIFQYLQWRPAE